MLFIYDLSDKLYSDGKIVDALNTLTGKLLEDIKMNMCYGSIFLSEKEIPSSGIIDLSNATHWIDDIIIHRCEKDIVRGYVFKLRFIESTKKVKMFFSILRQCTLNLNWDPSDIKIRSVNLILPREPQF